MMDYCWQSIPCEEDELPIVLVDVDGTMRGDVIPMIRMVRLLIPDYIKKLTFQEPLNAHKALQFLINVTKLWALRTIYSEQRRRYKHLFSELHYLAAAILQGTEVEKLRSDYRTQLSRVKRLWHTGAVDLLRRLTASANVVLVTGSEQIQTEECVRLLADRGVVTRRIFVRGSLYGVDRRSQKFTGTVDHLNVTIDGKRDVVSPIYQQSSRRIMAAIGNSRPDRALFEAVRPGGLSVLVCPGTVFRARKERTFVLRKLQRSGYRLVWDVPNWVNAVHNYVNTGGEGTQPVLATDSDFQALLENEQLAALYPEILLDRSAETRADAIL